MIRSKLLLLLISLLTALSLQAGNSKREFRGAWINTIYRSEYHDKTTAQCKKYLQQQLDQLQASGINVVIFQVRPQADAFYDSKLEPWSRFLTDNGKAPVPFWDPLQFMIEQCHMRGMELHAWLNPYRVTSSKTQRLPKSHIYHKHPERFINYEGKWYFDPALEENRRFIVSVVNDIVTRYDVDGIHFDDYFYPYPGKTAFPDGKSFAKYGKGMALGDWRRRNIDMLIEAVHDQIRHTKPWVRFGVSPFGIWRNSSSDSRGSETSGLENYDALYADVLLWAHNGWVDYLLPQLYWEVGHKRACYDVLIQWWNDNVEGCQLYIGQDANKCMDVADTERGQSDQLDYKLHRAGELGNISGVCWWPAYSLTSNYKGISDRLKSQYQSSVSLVPEYDYIESVAPAAPINVKIENGELSWTAAEPTPDQPSVNDVVRYVVYHFNDKSKVDTDQPSSIIAVTNNTRLKVDRPGKYVVTALNRVNRESQPSSVVTKQS